MKLYYLYILRCFENHRTLSKIKSDIPSAVLIGEQRHVLEKKDSSEKMLSDERSNSREMSQQQVFIAEQIDQALLEIFDAVSLNIFRFVFNNVSTGDAALRLGLLSDEFFTTRRTPVRQDGAQQSPRRVRTRLRVRAQKSIEAHMYPLFIQRRSTR